MNELTLILLIKTRVPAYSGFFKYILLASVKDNVSTCTWSCEISQIYLLGATVK